MYTWLAIGGLVIAAALITYRPSDSDSGPEGIEGFTTTAVHPTRMPNCVARSTDAQKLLARVAGIHNEAADELRLLVSKLCCMEADIATPSTGKYRTLHSQYRTSHDLEPAATLVGRCLRNAVPKRDVELVIEKFSMRGHVLVKELCSDAAAHNELDSVVARLQMAMMSFCLKDSPKMDRPAGARDLGFWETEAADLPQYQGVSAQPR